MQIWGVLMVDLSYDITVQEAARLLRFLLTLEQAGV